MPRESARSPSGDGSDLPTHYPPLTPRRSGLRSAPSPKEAMTAVLKSWVSRQFLYGCAVLFPIAVTAYSTLWVINFFERFFSPLYESVLGFSPWGLGFATSMAAIFTVGLLASSWVGNLALGVGEWVIKKLPLARHIYGAAKQVSAALRPSGDESTGSFKDCVLIKHPRLGSYMIGFVTGLTTVTGVAPPVPGLNPATPATLDLVSVFVPTNHIYVGDVFLVPAADVIRTEMGVREGIEAIVSVGMALPKRLAALPPPRGG